MTIFLIIVSIVLGYVFGSIPFGWIIVKITSGQDIREVGSGRTGGTNVSRAAGLWAGVLTALLDIFKVTFAVVFASWITGGNHFAEAMAGALGVLGHNNSLFFARRVTTEDGKTKLQFQGGAGGASSLGGALALWAWSVAYALPVGLFFLFIVGYASVATIGVGITLTIVFILRAAFYDGPWEHVIYGVLVVLMQAWALRPNFERLMNGTERIFDKSLRGKLRARTEASTEKQ